MKVFISWSGEFSQRVAEELRPWLPKVIQKVVPYVSSKDIYVGDRWLDNISGELEDSSCGILCLTKDNLEAPWLNFEAGALSKSLEKGRVIPFMFGVKPSDLAPNSPLSQFQATRQYTKEELYRIVESLNIASGLDKLEDEILKQTFDMWWPELKGKLDVIEVEAKKPSEKVKAKPKDSSEKQEEILEEVLQLTRSQMNASKNEQYEKYAVIEKEFDELIYMLKNYGGDSYVNDLHHMGQSPNRIGHIQTSLSGFSPSLEGREITVERIIHRMQRIRRNVRELIS